MLEAQKILHLSQMNNQATKEHRAHNEPIRFFLCLYEHLNYLFILPPPTHAGSLS